MLLSLSLRSKYALLLAPHIMAYNHDLFLFDRCPASCSLTMHPVLKRPRFKGSEYRASPVIKRSLHSVQEKKACRDDQSICLSSWPHASTIEWFDEF